MFHRRNEQFQQQQQQRARQRQHAAAAGVDNSLYEALGVARTATDDEIKKAYRRLAAQYHPDKPTGDEAKMKTINNAYEILTNPQKKRVYDLGGLGGVQQQQQRQSAGAAQQQAASEMLRRMFESTNMFTARADDSDGEHPFASSSTSGPGGPRMFSFAFGEQPMFGRQQQQQEKEADIHHPIDVTLDSVFAQQPINIEVDVRRRKVENGGAITLISEKAKFKLTLKSWNDIRAPIVLRGKGNQSRDENVQDGNIVIRINLLDHTYFTAANSHDLVLRHTISFQDALCGFDFKVPFIDSAKTMLHFSNRDKPSEFVQPGSVFQCPCGLPLREADESAHSSSASSSSASPPLPLAFDCKKANRNDFGMLYIVLDVEAPDSLDDEQRQLLAKRLAAGAAAARPTYSDVLIPLERAPVRVELQLSRDLFARKAEMRAMRRQTTGDEAQK